MADIVADTTESVVNVDELAKIESLKELVKEAGAEVEAVSSKVLDNDEDSTNPAEEGEGDQNGTHDENEHNGNGTHKTGEDTNGTHEPKEENGSVDLKRKSEGEVNAEDVSELLPEKKAKLAEEEEEEKDEEDVAANGDGEIAV